MQNGRIRNTNLLINQFINLMFNFVELDFFIFYMNVYQNTSVEIIMAHVGQLLPFNKTARAVDGEMATTMS